jgi:hypothetical protein
MFFKKNHRAMVALFGVLTVMPLSASAWYIGLDVIGPNHLHDRANMLGQLPDSQNTYDLHDLRELAPFGAPYLTLVFPHADWGSQAGSYATDFHAPSALADSWSFDVISDLPNREITLKWVGDAASLARSQLVDVTANKTISVAANKSYTVTMTGQTRRSFVWNVLPLN